ncbi:MULTISPECIES: phosphodiester glycosidase family protein [unclassified Paenibacillus]|uniref:phosphodiester glycosidase family protein n=1 Tax=unclassified Paenibacillus TaxID=185978 RepID=UPI001B4321B1|nr:MULTISPECIES: phosphodiester glycosidase family protein [unclassified Paenibacillus]MBP1156602.1 exopolysaccharide biosynthesis protein [Paenibacillus sp. PvP091]MBP1172660.1 exopolysaccharide biosynthesis protein [Paenibacillus sp. PvR098]MBP2439040.1 exopolysaccharide biosynthesis protein [Paenibacillus sp. PvP052]
MVTVLQRIRSWGRLKRTLFGIALFTFLTSSFLFLTGPGNQIRVWLAETVITTQHRSWAWIFVGAEQRDLLVQKMQNAIEDAAREKQDLGMVSISQHRSADEWVQVEDISGPLWKGKKMYVFDPKSIRVMTPFQSGEGERITSMVSRTGAVAGVNGGSFDDPEGLGNGFAAIGVVISGGDIIFTDQDGSIPQHIIGFTKEGKLVIGKYNIFELRDMGISEAVSFYPRLIANGKPLITSGDGGWGRAPRTAVGQKPDGTVIFIVIDGRQSNSVGATLKEVQDILLKEGAVNAGNLDGGASSELVVGDQLVTHPSSRYGERRLPSAFLVYDNPSAVVANRVWDGVDKIDPGGSYDHPEFLREQAEKKARQQQNPAPVPAKPASVEKPKSVPASTETKPSAGGEENSHSDKADTSAGATPTKPSATETGNSHAPTVQKENGSSVGSEIPSEITAPPPVSAPSLAPVDDKDSGIPPMEHSGGAVEAQTKIDTAGALQGPIPASN